MIYILILLFIIIHILNNNQENFKQHNLKYTKDKFINYQINKLKTNPFQKVMNFKFIKPITTHSHFKYDTDIDKNIKDTINNNNNSTLMEIYDNLVNDGRHIVTSSNKISPFLASNLYEINDNKNKYGYTKFATY